MREKLPADEKRERQSEGGKKGGANSSRKGIPNKRTEEMRNKMEDMGAKPEEFLAHIMMGTVGTGDIHPMVEYLLTLREEHGDKLPPRAAWGKVFEMLDDAVETLIPVPPLEERAKAAKELMPYLFPKLKSVDHTSGGKEIRLPTTQLYLPDNKRGKE